MSDNTIADRVFKALDALDRTVTEKRVEVNPLLKPKDMKREWVKATNKPDQYGSYTRLINYPVGTRFHVVNGEWDGEITEHDGIKHILVEGGSYGEFPLHEDKECVLSNIRLPKDAVPFSEDTNTRDDEYWDEYDEEKELEEIEQLKEYVNTARRESIETCNGCGEEYNPSKTGGVVNAHSFCQGCLIGMATESADQLIVIDELRTEIKTLTIRLGLLEWKEV